MSGAVKPPAPQSVLNPKEAPSTPSWLFLFYQWVVSKFTGFDKTLDTTDFVVGTATTALGAERVATDTPSIDVDIGTAGQMKWNVLPAGVDHGGLAGLSDDDHPQYVLRSILTTNGDLFTRAGGAVTRLGIGTAGQVLSVVSGAPAWATVDHGDLAGLSDDDHPQYVLRSILTTNGDLFTRAGGAITRLGIGTAGQVLSVVSGAPAWATVDHGDLAGLSDDDHPQYVLRSILTTDGDLFTRAGGAITRLGIGTAGQVLSVVSGAPAWATVDHGDLAGLSDDDHPQYVLRSILTTDGDLFTRASGAVTRLGIGTAGQVLSVVSGAPAWATLDHGDLAGLSDDDHPQYVLRSILTTDGDLFTRASGAVTRLGIGTAGQVLSVVSGAPAWATLDHGDLAGLSDDDHPQYVLRSILTTDGDLFVRAGGVITRLGIGTAGQVLTVVSGAPAWADATGGGGSDILLEPGGRLTLQSGAPVMTAEQADKTAIYYTPYKHNLCPIYDGTAWTLKQFAELTLTLGSNWAALSIYDLYVINDGGTIRLATGAAWTDTTTRSESLTRLNGILTNAAAMTARYSNTSTVSVPANRATYVGTFRTTASAGTTTWELGGAAAGGDPVRLFLWNCYNRVTVGARAQDTTAFWAYSSATVRPSAGGYDNYVSYVVGLAEDAYTLAGLQLVLCAADSYMAWGLGAADSLTSIIVRSLVYAVGSVTVVSHPGLSRTLPPALGYHYHYLLEHGDGTWDFLGYGGSQNHFIDISIRM